MEIIPVIDVRHGAAVRARGGDRARYRPLETPLAPSADPVAVARGLLSLYPFRTLYVADLDGIEGRGANAGLVAPLAAALPGVELWIDDGSFGPPFAEPGVVRVVGSESLTFPSPHLHGERARAEPCLRHEVRGRDLAPSQASAPHPNPLPARGERGKECVLSLDFRGEEFLGPPEILDNVGSLARARDRDDAR